MTSPSKRAAVIGTGLIGGSIGLALRERGWHVTGRDRDHATAVQALELGAIDELGADPDADVTFVATPVSSIVTEARQAVSAGGVVTDVGSVKAPIVAAVDHPRFVGGHPMAGSEQDGIEGADPTLFDGATWVLTPAENTDAEAYATLQTLLSSLGAEVLAMPPERHDEMVALVSHVPHLTAASLMCLADDAAEEHGALLRLAAGGFRDMTRVAAGQPGIWLDICDENRDAILAGLDRLGASLGDVRQVIAEGDRDGLLELLERARVARTTLPVRVAARAEDMVEVRVPVPDRTGVLAELTTLATDLGVNIEDLEIAHSVEGDRGVLLLVIDADQADLLRGAFLARGYRPAIQPLAGS